MKNQNPQTKDAKVFDKRNFYTEDDSGKVFIISLLAPVLVSLLVFLIGSAIIAAAGGDPQTEVNSVWFQAINSFLTSISFVGVYLIYNKVCKIDNRAVDFNFKIGWKNYVIAIAIGIVSLFGLQQLISLFDELWLTLGVELQELSITNFGLFALYTFTSAITPAIVEEIVFRGMILNGLRSKFNDYASIALSALMFALMHGSLQQLVYPFLLGLILGWIKLRTGSIIPCMIVHFTNNFLTLLLTYLLGSGALKLPVTWWSIILAIVLACLVFVIVYLLDRFVFKHQSKITVERKEGKMSLFLWVSFALSGLIFLYNLVALFV